MLEIYLISSDKNTKINLNPGTIQKLSIIKDKKFKVELTVFSGHNYFPVNNEGIGEFDTIQEAKDLISSLINEIDKVANNMIKFIEAKVKGADGQLFVNQGLIQELALLSVGKYYKVKMTLASGHNYFLVNDEGSEFFEDIEDAKLVADTMAGEQIDEEYFYKMHASKLYRKNGFEDLFEEAWEISQSIEWTEDSGTIYEDVTKGIIIPYGVTKIGATATDVDITLLVKETDYALPLVFPDTLKVIGDNTFAHLSEWNAHELIFEDMDEIGPSAFVHSAIQFGPEGISKFNIPITIKNVDTISTSAFINKTNMDQPITIENVDTIKSTAFGNWDIMNKPIKIKNIRIIEAAAFQEWPLMNSPIVIKDIDTIGSVAFSGWASMNNPTTIENVELIQSTAFQGWNSFNNLILLKDIGVINSGAFSMSALDTPMLLQNIEKIDNSAFTIPNFKSILTFKNVEEIWASNGPHSDAIVVFKEVDKIHTSTIDKVKYVVIDQEIAPINTQPGAPVLAQADCPIYVLNTATGYLSNEWILANQDVIPVTAEQLSVLSQGMEISNLDLPEAFVSYVQILEDRDEPTLKDDLDILEDSLEARGYDDALIAVRKYRMNKPHLLPAPYVQTTTTDFGEENGIFKYLSTDPFIILPEDLTNMLGDLSLASTFRGTNIKGVATAFEGQLEGLDLTNTFAEVTSENIALQYLDTSGVIGMEGTFYSSDIDVLDLRTWDFSSVETMAHMFKDSPLVEIKFPTIVHAEKVEDMTGMLYGVELEHIDLSSFITSDNLKDMLHIISNSLADVETISFGDNFVTSGVNSFFGIIPGYSTLESVDISSFTFETATDLDIIDSLADLTDPVAVFIKDQGALNIIIANASNENWEDTTPIVFLLKEE